MEVCTASVVPNGGQLLVLLHWDNKQKLTACTMRIIYLQNVCICFFKNRLVSSVFFHSAALKTIRMKKGSAVLTPHFL